MCIKSDWFIINIISGLGGRCLPCSFLVTGDQSQSDHYINPPITQCDAPNLTPALTPSTHLTAYNFSGIFIYIHYSATQQIWYTFVILLNTSPFVFLLNPLQLDITTSSTSTSPKIYYRICFMPYVNSRLNMRLNL